MSMNNDPEERNLTSSTLSKILYTREYLLSLSELEVCKRLPEGIDESLLSEFRSLPEQGVRHNDYGSSPPEKEGTRNFSRGFQRWDNRTSWRSDSDSKSDRDSDSGKLYGNQSRRSWQNPEHDGLLGSGSVPRPPGYGPGSSVPPSDAKDQRQLNRSNDPYNPPRPYKAVTHSWRETKDSLNDETFGSAEDTDEDRAEQERKRRAEFEMMRKEQHKVLQEKQKLKTMNKLKDDPLTELAASVDAGDSAITIGLDTSLVKPIQQNDFSKSSISSQVPPFRPSMPPGFANAATKKISGPNSFGNPLEVGKPDTGDFNQEKKPALQPRMDVKHSETTFLWNNKGGKKAGLLSASVLSSKVDDPDLQSMGASKRLGNSEILENDKVTGIGLENDSGRKIVEEAGHATSILGNLFEGALNIQNIGPSNIIEDDNMRAGIDLSSKDIHSSKFAQWFQEEERKPMESASSDKPNALFSLIVGEKSGSVASDRLTSEQILPPETNLVTMGPLYNKTNLERSSAVLTCEDLEQSIISNFGGNSSSSQPPGILFSQHGSEKEIPLAETHNSASHHLLSLLQKGNSSNSKATSPFSIIDKGLHRESLDLDSERAIQGNSRDLNAENLTSGKGLTLETLFGSAFMNELQSFDAPISVRRNSAGSSSINVPESSMQPVAHSANGAVNTSVSEARFKRFNHGDSNLGLDRTHQTDLEKVGMSWPIADSSQYNAESPNLQRFDMMKPEMTYPSMQALSSQQFNHGRPAFPPLGINNRQDAPLRHQISGNLGHPPFQTPNSGLSQFDLSMHHPMLQQMHMPNNFPGGGGNAPGYVEDHNLAHRFPFGQQQPNPVDFPVPLQGGEHGNLYSDPPQTFHRLLEMELRSNPNPRHTSFSSVGGHSRPMFGHELDTGFWHR